jgi:hypothetical protein
MNTTAVIVLPNWPCYKAITKELKLLRQIPIGEPIFMRPTLTGSYDPLDVIKSIWVINYWVIDVDTPIMDTTSAIAKAADTAAAQSKAKTPTDSPTNELESKTTLEAADKYLSTTAAMVII